MFQAGATGVADPRFPLVDEGARGAFLTATGEWLNLRTLLRLATHFTGLHTMSVQVCASGAFPFVSSVFWMSRRSAYRTLAVRFCVGLVKGHY